MPGMVAVLPSRPAPMRPRKRSMRPGVPFVLGVCLLVGYVLFNQTSRMGQVAPAVEQAAENARRAAREQGGQQAAEGQQALALERQDDEPEGLGSRAGARGEPDTATADSDDDAGQAEQQPSATRGGAAGQRARRSKSGAKAKAKRKPGGKKKAKPKLQHVSRYGCMTGWQPALKQWAAAGGGRQAAGNATLGSYAGNPFHRCREAQLTDAPLHTLESVVILKTGKARPPAASAITIITQLSVDRLPMLRRQCENWDGPIAATLYFPMAGGRLIAIGPELASWNGSEVVDLLLEVQQVHAAIEEAGRCQLDLELLVEERCSLRLATFWPVNALRNRAVQLARTEGLLLLDVDFLVGGVEQEGKYGLKWMLNAARAGRAVVLPGFGTSPKLSIEDGTSVALGAVEGGKQAVAQLWAKGHLNGFEMEEYPRGHEGDEHERWMQAEEPFVVKYLPGYEPYLMMHRDFCPWYDERFDGRWVDKIMHIRHISSQGTQLVASPRAFVVHIPHAHAAVRVFGNGTDLEQQYEAMYRKSAVEMEAGTFRPTVSFPHMCM